MALDPLEILGSPIYVSIDGADIHEDAVSKLTREFSPHPLQRTDAAAAARADHKNGGMALGIERRRIRTRLRKRKTARTYPVRPRAPSQARGA
jgi:hypothetical protein